MCGDNCQTEWFSFFFFLFFYLVLFLVSCSSLFSLTISVVDMVRGQS